MYLLHRINNWSEKHYPLWLDFLRMILGIILLWKGLYLLSHKQAVIEIVQMFGYGFYTMTLAHFVIGVHLAGGLLIFAGLLTRFAVILQIPVLLSSLVFVVIPNGFMSIGPEAELTVLVLALLIVFLFEGSGHLSLDEYINRHPG